MTQKNYDEKSYQVDAIVAELQKINNALSSIRIDLDILAKGQQILFNQQQAKVKAK
jgi:hypothetical protein